MELICDVAVDGVQLSKPIVQNMFISGSGINFGAESSAFARRDEKHSSIYILVKSLYISAFDVCY